MSNRENMFAEPSTSSGNRHKHFKLQKGSARYRIGPAYGSLAASGRWNLSIRQHYGYRVTGDEQNPNGFPRTFICPEERNKSDMVTTACAECADIEALKEKLTLREQKLIDEGKSEEQINTILGSQKKYLKEHNLDKKHIVLAKNDQGEWGVLWLPWKALEALINRRQKIREEDGIDILSTKEGAWVEFTRTGDGFRDTAYACDAVYEMETLPNGKKAKSIKQESLAEADFDAIVASCPDLSTVGTRLTPEQIERLVESKGDMDVADAIFKEAREVRKESSPKPATNKVQNRPAPKREVEEEPEAPAEPKPSNVAPKAAAPTGGGDDEMAALRAQLAQMQAMLAAKEQASKDTAARPEPKAEVREESPAPTPRPKPNINPDDMDDKQFMDVFGPKR